MNSEGISRVDSTILKERLDELLEIRDFIDNNKTSNPSIQLALSILLNDTVSNFIYILENEL